jgi:dTMP kinase
MKSKFYTVEGLDGSGKSTIAKYMGQCLSERGIPNLVVEAYPRDEDAMFKRDLWIQQKVPPVAVLAIVLELRARVLKEQIIPALLEGKVVISDRWHDTTWVYQGAGQGIGDKAMKAVFDEVFDLERILSRFIFSDRRYLREQLAQYNTVHLDVSLDVSRQRVGNRLTSKDAFELAEDEFFMRLSEGYQILYASRYEVINPLFFINADRDIESVKKDVHEIMDKVVAPNPPK